MAEPSDRRSAPTVFGVHAGLQNTDTATLRALWRRIEDLGFGWISIWDHFYAANASDDAECLEAVATHAALACDTSSVRCGSLVYSVGYRHPAVLANAICTIDQLSGGRADLGLGAGWSEIEYRAYGIPFPPVKVRMDMLEECDPVRARPAAGRGHDFEGTYFQLHEARCEPKPVQAELPIWVGGQRREADAADRGPLGRRREHPVRRPSHVRAQARRCSSPTATTSAATRPRSAPRSTWGWRGPRRASAQQFGGWPTSSGPGVLTGSDAEVVDRIGRYVEAGADQVNLALRAPFDVDALERFAGARSTCDGRGAGARAGQPDRRPHRLHGRAGAADGHRPVDHGAGRALRRRGGPAERARALDVEVPLDVVDPAGVEPAVGSLRRRGRGRGPSAVRSERPGGLDRARRRGPVVERRPRGGRRPRPRRRGLAARHRRPLPASRATGQRRAVRDHGPAGVGRRRRGRGAAASTATPLDVRPVPLPPTTEVEVVVVHSGVTRALAGSAYAERARQCANAERIIGPLRVGDARRRGADQPPDRAGPRPARDHRERAGRPVRGRPRGRRSRRGRAR